MSTPVRRSTHRPVSNHFAGATAAGTRTQLRITENGVFALGVLVGIALTLLGFMFVDGLASSGPQLECVATSNVSEPVCGEPTIR